MVKRNQIKCRHYVLFYNFAFSLTRNTKKMIQKLSYFTLFRKTSFCYSTGVDCKDQDFCRLAGFAEHKVHIDDRHICGCRRCFCCAKNGG